MRRAWLLAVLAAAPVHAAVFRDVIYARDAVDERAQSLDVYTPGTPGPHGVVLYVAGDADKGATRGRHATFNARGLVFASANLRYSNLSDAADDVAALLGWAQRSASRYGGDPERIQLVAAGSAAAAALAACDDPTRRSTQALVPRVPAALVALAPAALPAVVPGPARRAPRLLLFDGASDASRAAAASYVERVRATGTSALALPFAARDASDIVRDFALPTDPDAELVLAWLDSRAIARVPRFEEGVYATQPLPAGVRAVDGLVAVPGEALLLAYRHEDGSARIAHRDAEAGAWRDEAGWPGADLAWLGDAHALRRDASGYAWCVRANGEWHATRLEGIAGDGPARVVRAGDAWLVATSGARRASFRIELLDGVAQARRDAPEGATVDALVACDEVAYATAGATMWRRGDSGWQRVAQWLGGAGSDAVSLACAPDPDGGDGNVLLAALADGRVLRVVPARGAVALELDAGAALRELWRAPALAVAAAPVAATRLRQPDSGDVVQAFALAVAHPDLAHAGAWWLLRALDASWSLAYLDADAGAAGAGAQVVASSASPFAADAGRAWFVALASAGGPVLLRGQLAAAPPRQGLWWDPSRPGSAVELLPEGEGVTVIVHDHDRDGTTRWTQHTGALDGGTFTEGGDPAGGPVLRIAFAGADGCRPPSARLTIERDGAAGEWCIEPFVLPRDGRPALDGSGTWRSTAPDERWELSTGSAGVGNSALGWVMLRWVDNGGRARWQFGVGPQTRGHLRAELGGGACAGCRDPASGAIELDWLGACGEGAGVATFEVREGASTVLARRAAPLAPIARQPCY